MHARSMEMTIRRGLMRMLNAQQAAAFATWLHVSRDLVDQEAKLNKALRQMMNRTLALGLNTWIFKYRAEKELMEQQHARMKQALGRMMHRALGMGWAGWRVWYLERVGDATRQQELLAKAALRMKYRAKFVAWNTWHFEMRWGVIRAARAHQAIIEMGTFRVEQAFDMWMNYAEAEKHGGGGLNPGHLKDRINLLMSDPSAKKQFESAMIHNLQQQNDSAMQEVKLLKRKLEAQQSGKPDMRELRDMRQAQSELQAALQASEYREKELARELQDLRARNDRESAREASKHDEMAQLQRELNEALAMIKSLQSGQSNLDPNEVVLLRVQLKEANQSIKATKAEVTSLKKQLAAVKDEEITVDEDNNTQPLSRSPSTSSRFNRSQSPGRRTSPLRGRSEDPQVKRMLQRAQGSWGW